MVAFSRVCKDMTAAAGPKSVRSTVALEACEDVPSCCSDCVCYIYIYIHIHIYIDIYICMIGIYGLCILVVCMYVCMHAMPKVSMSQDFGARNLAGSSALCWSGCRHDVDPCRPGLRRSDRLFQWRRPSCRQRKTFSWQCSMEILTLPRKPLR